MKRDTIDPGLLRMLVCVPFILLGVVCGFCSREIERIATTRLDKFCPGKLGRYWGYCNGRQ